MARVKDTYEDNENVESVEGTSDSEDSEQINTEGLIKFNTVVDGEEKEIYISPEDFQREVEKTKTIEESVANSPARQAIEEKKNQHKMFLDAMNVNNDDIISYTDPQEQQQVSDDTEESMYQGVEVPQEQNLGLPELPKLFNTDLQPINIDYNTTYTEEDNQQQAEE